MNVDIFLLFHVQIYNIKNYGSSIDVSITRKCHVGISIYY